MVSVVFLDLVLRLLNYYEGDLFCRIVQEYLLKLMKYNIIFSSIYFELASIEETISWGREPHDLLSRDLQVEKHISHTKDSPNTNLVNQWR